MRNILILMLLLNFCTQVIAACEATSIRTVHGAEPLASKLYEAAKITDGGAWKDGDFFTEGFTYLGDFTRLGKTPIHVTYLATLWGASTCRGSYRLIFFDSQFKQVGQYKSIEKPTFIANNTLSIPYEKQPLTTWLFTGKLPECLEVGGDCFPLGNGKAL